MQEREVLIAGIWGHADTYVYSGISSTVELTKLLVIILELFPSRVRSYLGGVCDAHGTSCWPMLLGHRTNLDDMRK